MISDILSPEVLRKKKMFILCAGIVIFFMTSMAKVLIPATIFQDLLKTGMDVNRISSLGAAFLYAYAASQLFMGCFSDRYGGVRILLIGGSLFSLGTITFPLLGNYYLMLLFRIITGFGAGTIFLGVAKLLGDLFSARFGLALGIVLLFGYLGPTTGTVPMVKLVALLGWKAAMIAPGIAALIPLIFIILLMKGTIKPVIKGQTFAPLWVMVKNKDIWSLSWACATVYGAYYAMVGQLGQKIFTDLYAFPANRAAFCMMILTIIVAANNMGGNLLLKLVGGRRKTVLVLGVISSCLGIFLGKYGFITQSGAVCFVISTLVLAVPAGFFPMFGLVAKELFPPQYMGMSVAFLNFMAFVFISLYQNVAGYILKGYPPDPETLSFPAAAYSAVYSFFIAGAVISLIAVFLVPETKNISSRQE